MIELKLTLDDIDYESLADLLAPAFDGQINNSNLPAWARMLLVAGGANGDTVKKLLAKIPDSKKEELIVQAVNHKTDQTAQKLEKLAASKGVHVRVTRIGAKIV